MSTLTRQPWTKEDLNTLQAMYPTYEASEIATKLNRTIPSIWNKAKKLSLKKEIHTIKVRRGKLPPSFNKLQQARKEALQIKELLKPSSYEYDFDEIAQRLNITPIEAMEAYDSGLAKIVKYVKSNPTVADELIALIVTDETFMEWDFSITPIH